MLGSITLGVFFRYFLNDAIIWSEEVARFSMIWVAFFGGALTFRQGGHVAITFFSDLLPAGLRRMIAIFVSLSVALFLITLMWTGGVMVSRVFGQTSAALEMSMSIPYAALPVGAGVMLYHMVMHWVLDSDDTEVARRAEATTPISLN
jgi:TRAP-type C4-dicarboxylate transport system permease small subunit